jgi:hypothetical protein
MVDIAAATDQLRMTDLITDPDGPAYPPIDTIITSHSSTSSKDVAADPFPYERIAQSLWENRTYPELPRLRVLTEREAGREIPGWSAAGTEVDESAGRTDGWSRWWFGAEAQARHRTVEVLGGTTVSLALTSRTRTSVHRDHSFSQFYMADDPEITGWGSLMYHYLYVPLRACHRQSLTNSLLC